MARNQSFSPKMGAFSIAIRGILTIEDHERIKEHGTLEPTRVPGDVPPCILSALRLCSHDLREKLVETLKNMGKLNGDFPDLKRSRPFPVPGAVSFTTLLRFAPVFRIFFDRHYELFSQLEI